MDISCIVSYSLCDSLVPSVELLPAEIRTETKIKTVIKTDTVLISAPIAVFWRYILLRELLIITQNKTDCTKYCIVVVEKLTEGKLYD